MKTLLYITAYNMHDGLQNGVVKKIRDQLRVFSEKLDRVDFIFFDDRERAVYLADAGEEKSVRLGKAFGIKGIDYWNIINRFAHKARYDCVYIRKTGRIDPWILRAINVLHDNGSRIIYELPTYPYDKDRYTSLGKVDMVIDKKYRKKLKRCVDRIATFSNDKVIFGMPTIQLMNGICVDKIQPVNANRTHVDTINLLGVSYMQPSHGYERIIKGIAQYVENGGRRIRLHLVGEGPEEKKYHELVSQYRLNDYVFFYPFMSGQALDAIYNQADLTLVDFGAYKEDIYLTSALKSRESLAKGIPLVTGCKIDVCEKYPFPYVLEFPNDASDVDIFEIERFYMEKIECRKRSEVIRDIREYAKKYVDMSVTMKPIIDYFLEK